MTKSKRCCSKVFHNHNRNDGWGFAHDKEYPFLLNTRTVWSCCSTVELLSLHYCSFLLTQDIPVQTTQTSPTGWLWQGSALPSQTSPVPGIQYCSLDSHTDILWWVSEQPDYFKFQTPKSLCTKNRAGKVTCFWGMFLRHGLRQGIDIVASGRDGSEENPPHCQMQSSFCR